MKRILAVLLVGVTVASTACATAVDGRGADPATATSASVPESAPAAAIVTAAPRPAGPAAGPFAAHTDDGVAYLTSFDGAGDAVAHAVIASVGPEGCLYFETSGFHAGPATETWHGVIGDPAIEVTAEGLQAGSTTIPYGTTFSASSTAIPPIDDLPAEHAQRCTGADQAWWVDIDLAP